MRVIRPDGRIAKLTLGPFDTSNDAEDDRQIGKPLTLAAARRLAADVGHQRAMGRDVMSDQKVAKVEMLVKHRERVANNFGQAVKDFIEGHAKPKTRGWQGTAKLLGLTPDGELVKGGLADRWGDRPLAEIDGGDIYNVVEEARQRGVPGMAAKGEGPSEARARHLHSALSKMFSWLHRHRRIETNPVASVHPPDPGGSRDRVLSAAEIVKFWKAADAEPTFGPLLKLLLLTGCRLNEVAGMRRSEIDGELWTIPKSRTKNHKAHVVPLPPHALDLDRVQEDGLRVHDDRQSPLSGWSKLKRRTRRGHGRGRAALALARSSADRRHRHGRDRHPPAHRRGCAQPHLRSAGRGGGDLQSRHLSAGEEGGAGAMGRARRGLGLRQEGNVVPSRRRKRT